MANRGHLEKFLKGVDAWNQWRSSNRELRPDLTGVDLSEADLSGADLSEADLGQAILTETILTGANLRGAKLGGADLREANLEGADLSEAQLGSVILTQATLRRANLTEANLRLGDLREAHFGKADLTKADLCEADLALSNLTDAKLNEANLLDASLRGATLIHADLTKAYLFGANLTRAHFGEASLIGADLTNAQIVEANFLGANLSRAILVGANLGGASLVKATLDHARLESCYVYGTSVWDVSLEGTTQRELIITRRDEDSVTVDDLKIAQFIYLLLKNREVRGIIDAITSKVVLILGRFTDERKTVLSALREALRARNYTPVLFDFEKPQSRDLTETILTLASMARFVIADISAAKSIPQELSHIIPNLPSVPIQPVLLDGDREYAMFEHWRRYPWVLPDFLYKDEAHLLASLVDKVIEPAERKRLEQVRT